MQVKSTVQAFKSLFGGDFKYATLVPEYSEIAGSTSYFNDKWCDCDSGC